MRIVSGDIVQAEADVIVNAANGTGYMGGWLGKYIRFRGVTESIHYATKGEVEQLAKNMATLLKPQPGDVFFTLACQLPAKYIYHAVTMSFPGMHSDLTVVEKCLARIVNSASLHRIQTIAIPPLGTGTGGLPMREV